MKHLTVGVFHDDTLGRDLGKKGTESDIAMYNRKTGDHIFTFLSPVEDKLSAKSQIVSSIDAAIVVFSGMTKELGETVVMLDSLGVSNGIAVTSSNVSTEQISAVTMATSLASFKVGTRDPINLLEVLKGYDPKRDTASAPLVVVDHSFSVKGVGEVVLGFVRKGIVKKYDELRLLPADKGVTVRSIQMQDEDYDEAEAGARVGLAIKGATVDEMKRGAILCAPGVVKASKNLSLSFEKSRFYSDDVKKGNFHATVGMQTLPVSMTPNNATSIAIESEKPIAYEQNETFLLLDLNSTKTRIMGKGRALEA